MSVILRLVLCFLPLILAFFIIPLAVRDFNTKRGLAASMLGLAAVIPITVAQFIAMPLFLSRQDTVIVLFLYALVLAGFIEESLKLVCLLPLSSKKAAEGGPLQKKGEAPAYFSLAVILGLSLGCFETAIYFLSKQQETGQILLRSVTAVVLHASCSFLSAACIWCGRQGRRRIVPFAYAVCLHGIYNFFASLANWLWFFSVVVLLFTLLECRIWYQKVAVLADEV